MNEGLILWGLGSITGLFVGLALGEVKLRAKLKHINKRLDEIIKIIEEK